MDKKPQKCPKNGGGVRQVGDPQDFFSKIVPSLLYPYGARTSCKILEKTNEQFPRYLKMDGLTD